MALATITQVIGTGVCVPGDDIDTDRIIPARFMKCLTFDGLGEFLFYDARRNEDGSAKEHPLDDERFAGANILISGNNFGCGSSREHAPQSIYRAGFRAVIAEGFAEIFFGNSINLGIPCVTAGKEELQSLRKAVEGDPKTAITIDVEKELIHFASQTINGHIRPGARDALVQGRWDSLQELLEAGEAIEKVETVLPY